MSFDGFIKRNIYWSVDFFKGRRVGKHFADICNILSDSKTGREKQNKHLENVLEHATMYSEFYKPYKGKTFFDFPVVNKSILNENHNKVKVDIEHIPEQETRDIHIHKTSGSTGVPFSVYQDSRKRNRRVAALKYFGEIVGYKSHEIMAQCRIWNVLRGKSKLQSFKENILPINISKMDEETIKNLCDTMHKKKVSALFGYGSWMESFCEYLKHNPQKFKHLKVIISSADMIKDTVREQLKDMLGCDVVERYANEEQGVLGQQTADSTCYYLNHASYYFEVLKFDSDEPADYGEMGRIVVTDLFNYAFPMIRYDTGDAGVLGKPDKNSMGYPVLEKLYGRVVDVVYATNGGVIHPFSFSTIFKSFEFIKQWQFVQKGEKEYLVRINSYKKAELQEEENLISHIKNVMGKDAIVSIEYVDEIPVLRSGKRKPVTCEWEREK